MGRRELLFTEYRVSVWDDEKKVLDLDCGLNFTFTTFALLIDLAALGLGCRMRIPFNCSM